MPTLDISLQFRHTKADKHQWDSDILKADNTLRFRYTLNRHTSAIQTYSKQTIHCDSGIPKVGTPVRFRRTQSRLTTAIQTYPKQTLHCDSGTSKADTQLIRTHSNQTLHCDLGILAQTDTWMRFGHTLNIHPIAIRAYSRQTLDCGSDIPWVDTHLRMTWRFSCRNASGSFQSETQFCISSKSSNSQIMLQVKC